MAALHTFDVRNRYTNAVQFTAQIEADPSAPHGLRLGLALKWGLSNGANLREAGLIGADLIGTDLSDANLSWAVLRWADLSGADLSRADLRWTDLSGTDLSDANLSWADLSGADLRAVDLRGADLNGTNLNGANLNGTNLNGANLSGEKISRIFARVQREIDPHLFVAVELEAGGHKILAGCRWFSDAEFRAHVAREYPDTDKATETLGVLDFIAARAIAHGAAGQGDTQ